MPQGTTEPTSAPTDVLQVQHQIRANASELQDYFADLYSWEKTINKEENERKSNAKPSPSGNKPQPRPRKTAAMTTTAQPSSAGAKPADAHTYDKGYKKWEKFDVDAALRDDDEEKKAVSTPPVEEIPTTKSLASAAKKMVTAKPKAAPASGKSREEIEKEEGNEHYKRGDYVAAIKSYTRALGFNSRNVVVLSNRAMAYIKNREYSKAEDDCTLALKIDDKHIKTYTRRGTARNSLGKHRLALLDFERALELDPKSKQISSQVTSTKELIRTAIKRAPKRTEFSIKVIGESPTPKKSTHDTTPHSVVEDKENAPRTMNRKIEIVEDEPVAPQATVEALKADAPKPPAAPATAPSSGGLPLPKVPKKAPATSYEFLRVWKTLAPKRGDPARTQKLQELRAEYLRLLPPSSLASVFKNSIESDILCEIFATIRQAFDVVGVDRQLTIELVSELPLVPRFSMTVMFLSDTEKADSAWVLDQLSHCDDVAGDVKAKLLQLKPLYGLK